MSLEEPPMKKQKQSDENSSNDIITDYIANVKNSKTELELILSDEYTKPIPMAKAYVGYIKNVKDTSKALKILNEHFPLKELSHLKRARRNNILICSLDFANTWSSIEICLEHHVPGFVNMFAFFREIDVPAVMPKMMAQYVQVVKTWSCNFHPDKYLENLAEGGVNADLHCTYIAMALETVRYYCKNKNIDVTEDYLKSINASVLVDPSLNSIVSVSFDERLVHPVKHSAMISIDNVARTQGGGSWSLDVDKNPELPCFRGIEEHLQNYLMGRFPDVKFGARLYVKDNYNSQSTNEKDYNAPYLCTNYYIYMLREPCLMCSMALTHARMKRVFYLFANKESGGLSSRVKLHTVPFLNHRLEVFTGFLETAPVINLPSQEARDHVSQDQAGQGL